MGKYTKHIIGSFLRNNHSDEVRSDFFRWLVEEKSLEEKNEALRRHWDELSVLPDKSTERSYRQVACSLKLGGKQDRRIDLIPWVKYAAAVVVLISSVAVTFMATRKVYDKEVVLSHIFVRPGNLREVTLSDGTVVTLNSSSQLLYPQRFDGKTRTVYLTGEALFKVAKNPDCPFIVRTSNLSVTALGTVFNINSYAESRTIEATLLEGSVRVCNESNNETFILRPGEQASYDKSSNRFSKFLSNPDEVVAWERGELIFKGCTVEEIFRALEQRFGVRFQYNATSFASDRFNLSFEQNESLSGILDVMKVVVGRFDYRKVDDNTYYITNR